MIFICENVICDTVSRKIPSSLQYLAILLQNKQWAMVNMRCPVCLHHSVNLPPFKSLIFIRPNAISSGVQVVRLARPHPLSGNQVDCVSENGKPPIAFRWWRDSAPPDLFTISKLSWELNWTRVSVSKGKLTGWRAAIYFFFFLR